MNYLFLWCLQDNVSFIALKDQKEKNGALFSSIISAAQRKVKRKTVKGGHTVVDGKEEAMKDVSYQSFAPNDLKQVLHDSKIVCIVYC